MVVLVPPVPYLHSFWLANLLCFCAHFTFFFKFMPDIVNSHLLVSACGSISRIILVFYTWLQWGCVDEADLRFLSLLKQCLFWVLHQPRNYDALAAVLRVWPLPMHDLWKLSFLLFWVVGSSSALSVFFSPLHSVGSIVPFLCVSSCTLCPADTTAPDFLGFCFISSSQVVHVFH